MTNTNTNTRAMQLINIIEFAKANGYAGEIDKLEKVYEQWTTKRERTNQPSKTAIENEALAKAVYEVMEIDEPVTNQWITEHVNGIMTTNKSAIVMGVLISKGLVVKCKVGKVMTYTRIK